MSSSNKIINSGFWQLLDVVTKVICQFVYFAVMARLLSKSAFGLMALTNSFVALGIIFAQSGMGAALIQRKDLNDKHINAALQGGFLFGTALLVVFYFIATPVALFFEEPELENLIRVLGLNFIFLAIGSASRGILHKRFLFKKVFITNALSISIGYSLGIYFGYQGYGVWSLLIATITYSFLQSIGYLWMAPIKFIFAIHLKEWKELFSFGFGIFLLRLNNYAGRNGLNLLLGKVFSASLLGVFDRTYQIKTLPSKYLGNVLDTVMFPAMSEIQDKKEKLFKLYQNSLGLVNSILIPVAIFLIFFSEEIVLILLGDQWLEAVIPLQIMFVVLPFSSSGRMADSVIRAKGMVYRNAWRKFWYVLVLLAAAGFGGYKFGLNGAAIGVTIGYLFNYITMLFLVKKVFNRSMAEIFINPVFIGLKLGLVVFLFLISANLLFGLTIISDLAQFFITTVILLCVLGAILFYKPSWLGVYIEQSSNKIWEYAAGKLALND